MGVLKRVRIQRWRLGLWVAVLAAGQVAAEVPALSYNPTSAEMQRFVVAAARATPFVSVASIGRSVQGRQIPVVILHDPAVSPLDVPRILILCRQHGNEPAGTVAMLGLIRDVTQGAPRVLEQLKRLCVLIVPMVNPDGADANQRHNAVDADLNRDWSVRHQPETQAVEHLFNLWNPDVVLDLHELHWRDKHGLNTVEAPEPGMVPEPLGGICRDLQADIVSRLQAAGLPVRVSMWNNSNKDGLAHRHFSRDHRRVSLLFESERQNLQVPLPQRALVHRIGVQTVLDAYESGQFQRRLPRLAMVPVATDATGVLPVPDGAPSAVTVQPVVPKIELAAPDASEPIKGRVRLRANLTGLDDLNYLTVRIDGQGRFFANRGPFEFDWNSAELSPGKHALLLQAHRKDGSVLEQEYVVTVDAP